MIYYFFLYICLGVHYFKEVLVGAAIYCLFGENKPTCAWYNPAGRNALFNHFLLSVLLHVHAARKHRTDALLGAQAQRLLYIHTVHNG